MRRWDAVGGRVELLCLREGEMPAYRAGAGRWLGTEIWYTSRILSAQPRTISCWARNLGQVCPADRIWRYRIYIPIRATIYSHATEPILLSPHNSVRQTPPTLHLHPAIMPISKKDRVRALSPPPSPRSPELGYPPLADDALLQINREHKKADAAGTRAPVKANGNPVKAPTPMSKVCTSAGVLKSMGHIVFERGKVGLRG